jgi:uncharacterized protein DUF1918
MHAQTGARIVVESRVLDGHRRYGEVLEVLRSGGEEHYRVRWEDDGHESIFYPGPDAHVSVTEA